MVTGDMAESPLTRWGRANVQPQFPQVQNGTNKDAPVNLVRLLARRLHSMSAFIIQGPYVQLAWLLMQQEFTVATGL